MARPRQVTDEQILEAMRRAVLANGAQVSLDAVAQQIGVTSPALIKRFGTRQNLLVAALWPNEEDLDEIFEVPLDGRPFVEQLESLIDRLSHYFAKTLPRVIAMRECGVASEVLEQKSKLPMLVRSVSAMTRWLTLVNDRGLIDSDMLSTAGTAIVGAVSTRMVSAHLSKRAWSRRSQRKYQSELAALFAHALHGAE